MSRTLGHRERPEQRPPGRGVLEEQPRGQGGQKRRARWERGSLGDRQRGRGCNGFQISLKAETADRMRGSRKEGEVNNDPRVSAQSDQRLMGRLA